MSLFRALKHRWFATLWAGQTLSRLGDFVYEIALAWWVLEKTGSPQMMSLVFVFVITPSVLFALMGGVAGDRFSRVGLMLGSDVARGGVVCLVAGLALTQQLEIWHVLLASFIFGGVDAFFQPAYMALMPQLVPEADLPSANSLTSLSMQLGRIGGPALGALIVTQWGAPVAFALNGASFILSTAFLLPLLFAHLAPPARTEAAASVWQEMRQGFTTVAATPWLWVSILVFGLTNITLAGPFSVAMPFLVHDFMRADVDTLGWLYAAFPIGYVIGGVFIGRYKKIRRRGWLMYSATAVAALLLGLFGFLPPLWVLMIAALINGAALEIGHIIWITSMQELVPNDQLGRVASIDALGSFALLPIGFALAGWATTAIGAPLVFIIGGLVTAVVTLVALFHPAIRGMD